jgi:hypothetical protein
MRIFLTLTLLFSLAACSNSKKRQQKENAIQEIVTVEEKKSESLSKYEKGTYGYDVNFLDGFPEFIELHNGDSRLLIALKYQGRVMTSTSRGYGGKSYGWINYDLIQSGEVREQFNPVGGEERFWLGPEGGQFSLYFEPGKSFVYENWKVPACIDSEPFDLFLATDSVIVIQRPMKVKNYSNFEFDFKLTRKIDLMGKKRIRETLGISIPENVSMVGYESTNEIKNTGEAAWKKETGLLSIWLLGMFIHSPSVTMVLPYRTDVQSEYIVKDDYFGKIPEDRLKIIDGNIYFKGDGKYRSKIGIPPQRALPVIGSYDADRQMLTLVKCDLPKGVTDYVNSAWELQKHPYKGDAINAFNDGPLEDGSQLWPFYELESSSPALALEPDSTGQHVQSTYHFEGSEADLDVICRQVFNVSLEEIKSVFGGTDQKAEI